MGGSRTRATRFGAATERRLFLPSMHRDWGKLAAELARTLVFGAICAMFFA